jgi:hypothetical protein
MTDDTGGACQFQFFIDGGSTTRGKTTATWGTPTGGVSDSTHSPFADYAGNYIGFTNVDIYPGAAPRPFNPPMYHDDLAYAERYYELLTAATEEWAIGGGTSQSATRTAFLLTYKVQKRADPSLTITAADWAVWIAAFATKDATGMTADMIDPIRCRIDVSAHATGATAGHVGILAADGSGPRSIIIDADL